MAPIASLLLWTIACVIEARLDTWVERYKLDLIDRQGVDIDTGKYWAYNPLRPYKIGLLRDGWHFMKGVYILLLAMVPPALLFSHGLFSHGLPWYCEASMVTIAMVLLRSMVFPLALKAFR